MAISLFIYPVVYLCAIVAIIHQVCPCPDMISRSRWNATTPKSIQPLSVDPPNYIVVHHSALEECFTEESCKKSVYDIQRLHTDTNGWEDIGYNFLIGGDGTVYEGRGWGIRGSHAIKYNGRSIGICLLGNFMLSSPREAQITALKEIIECGVIGGNIAANYRLFGHRQANPTLCPGDLLYDKIVKWDHFGKDPSK